MKEKMTNTANVLDFEALPTHARLTAPVTILKGRNPRPLQVITLGALIDEIRTTDLAKLNDSKSIVCEYENYLKNVELKLEKPKATYESRKDLLNGFLIGNYSYRMDEKEKCLEYVPCLVFDLDACASTYQRFLLQTKLQELDYVFAAFPSPSGYGLRVLVWTAATYETHRNVYQKIVEELCKFLGVTANKADGVHFDASCKNESRHFYYVAVEKNKFYLNLESKIFEYHSISEPLPVNKPTIILQEKTIEKENIDNYTYIDALTEDVKVEFILKSINMNKPRKLQCFDFGCLCKENNVPFDLAKSVAMQHFYDSEQKNPEKVITTQLKDGYDQTNARYSDEQFIAFLRDTYHVKVVLAPRKNETIEKKETISTPQDKTEAEIERNYKKNLKKVKNESKNDFPIEAFPSKTAEIIKAFQNADGYPMDYCNNSSFFYTTKYLFIQECTTEWISFKKRGIPKKNYLCAKIIRLC